MTAGQTSAATRRVGVCLEPCDVLFFRDGRPFAAASYGESGLPLPQTLAGALCTRLLEVAGCDAAGFERLSTLVKSGSTFPAAAEETCGAGWVGQVQARGPWLCRVTKGRPVLEDVFVPVPATLHRPKAARPSDGQGFVRLDPLSKGRSLPGWQPLLPTMRPLWPREHLPTERCSGYLTREGLSVFLSGETPDPTAGHWLAEGEIFDYDRRTGIGVDAERYTAEHGLIYGVRYLVLKPGIALYAEIVLPPDAPKEVLTSRQSLPFGGEGRRAAMQPVEPFDWPAALPGAGQGTLLLLTTPGLFDSGQDGESWRPACLDGDLPLLGAAVPGFVPVSGWNLALSGPKPNRFAVPAGSAYFLAGNAQGLPEDSLADSPEDRRQGWACFVRGVWNDG